MANKPIIRETLNQYLNLVKQLTNQSNNQNMTNELINLITKNEEKFESAKIITKTLNSIDNQLINKLDTLVKVSDEDFQIIDTKIKSAGFVGFKVIPRFTYDGVKMIRFDIVDKEDERIVIQLAIIDYKIHSHFWAHNKSIELKIKDKLNNQVDFFYDFEMTTDEIFNKTQDQIEIFLAILK